MPDDNANEGSSATSSAQPNPASGTAQPGQGSVQTAGSAAQTGSAGSGGTKQAEPATKAQITALGIFLLVLGVLFVYLFIMLWPAGMSPTSDGGEQSSVSLFFHQLNFSIPLDTKLIFLVMVAGGLGSFVHIATSFSGHVAGGNLTKHWDWWYILRPGIGMVLALVFYLAIRGGFLSIGNDAGKINPYGIAGMAALVGMFSKQAVAKLSELFDTLFKTETQPQGKANPVPSVDGVQPQSIQTGSTNLGISITGKGFVSGAQVKVNGANRNTVLVDSAHLTATLIAADVANKGEISVTVANPKPGGGDSNAVKIAVA